MDVELSQLKTLPLETYAAVHGYQRDSTKSSRTVTVLRREADDDKLLVMAGNDGHWVYRSERNPTDHGTILDFCMARMGCNLGEARKQLRAWASLPSHPAQKPHPGSGSDKAGQTGQIANVPLCPPVDRPKVKRIWAALGRGQLLPYLLTRKIPLSTLTDARFTDCWRQGRDGVAFPSWDQQGLCGLEFRGEGVKRFLSGGRKALWVSRNVKICSRLVVCEAPIDCLSYHALHVDAADWEWPLGYIAFGGGLGSLQRELLAGLLRQAAERGCEIVAATDNDPAGDRYAETLAELAGIAIERVCPYGKDFNADWVWCVRENGGEL
jgi:hypothetical protein